MPSISASEMLLRAIAAAYFRGRCILRPSLLIIIALCCLTLIAYGILLPVFTGSTAKGVHKKRNPSSGTANLTDVSASTARSPASISHQTPPWHDSPVKILHQSWKSKDLPPRFRRWSQSFSRCHPEWQRRLWTDADNESLIAKHFPWFLPTYNSLNMPVQKADVSRLFYMYRFGGVYCDLDCECLRPFEHLLANVSLAFGAMEGHTVGPADGRYVEEGQIENGFMYSIPSHPFILRLIKQLQKDYRYLNGNPEDTTGPYLLMREIHRLRRSKEGVPALFRGKKYLEVFPPNFFNPFSWMANKVSACIDKGSFSRADEAKCRAAYMYSNHSFVLQYHTQVWFGGQINLNKD